MGSNSVAVSAATSDGDKLGCSQDGHNDGGVSQFAIALKEINIGGSCNVRCVITKCVSLVAISAAISSRSGNVRCFSGTTQVFTNTNETWLLSVGKMITPCID